MFHMSVAVIAFFGTISGAQQFFTAALEHLGDAAGVSDAASYLRR